MANLSFIVFILLFLSMFCVSCVKSYSNNDYCSLCQNHTMCVYTSLGHKCGYTSYGGYLTEDEKKTIVDTHNQLRALVASGGEARGNPGPQPPATDMQQLEWDEDLARTAQAWADQCDFGHDFCRMDPRFTVGQNVFQSEGGVPWEQAILSWYSEVQFLDNSMVDNFLFDDVTGHYVQMVWGNTRYIGCGKRTYPQKLHRYYKRDTSHAESIEPNNADSDRQDNIRQSRRIDNNSYKDSNRNYDFSSFTRKPSQNQNIKNSYTESNAKGSNYKYSNYDFSSFTQKPRNFENNKEITYSKESSINNNRFDYSSNYNTQPTYWNTKKANEGYTNEQQTYDYYQNYANEEWKRYNSSIREYYEKYGSALQNTDYVKKQLKLYENYLNDLKQLSSPYLSYDQKYQLFVELQNKHENLEKMHQRIIYHNQKLKEKIASTKKLNPYIPKEYSFSTETPVISGQVFEYYVCNYGPAGLWSGARMYTRGQNYCQYDGLCKDPLTVSYYPGTDWTNDSILASLYGDKKK